MQSETFSEATSLIFPVFCGGEEGEGEGKGGGVGKEIDVCLVVVSVFEQRV
jgi:hypothetical protein